MLNGREINSQIDILFYTFGLPENAVKDGIVDAAGWDEEDNSKILFILKERNLNDRQKKLVPNIEEQRDFRISLHKGWPVLGQWAYAIQEIIRTKCIPKFLNAQENHLSALRRAALINLKKTPGRETSNSAEIEARAQKDEQLLNEQVKLIQPKIILCGGRTDISVFSIASNIIENSPAVPDSDHFIHRDTLGRIWINFYHPSCRLSHETMFGELCQSFLQSLLK